MPANKRFFVTGIGTGIGKTLVSAILLEILKADYWKPVQSGDLDKSDTLSVKNLISNP
ncbi:MAG: AAA family ATPase, partial [Bacteroidetes bacterium]|nr:AAA family ATPase [Bacteroidota bacterium]